MDPKTVQRMQIEMTVLADRIRGLEATVSHLHFRVGNHNNLRKMVRRLLGIRLGVLWQHAPRVMRLPASYSRTPVPVDGPTVSIVTPSYNQGPYLERTLRSVLDQGYPRLEYVVQDGGSTDESRAILERHAARLTHWVSASDNGQSQAINRGFRRTTGEIMAYLNSDDVLLPGSLAYVARYFMDHPEVDAVYGHRILIDGDDGEVGRWVMPPHDAKVLTWADYVPQETLFWRRRLWEKVGGIDESFQFSMDWDLLLRFQEAGAQFVRLPRFLGAFRIHSVQKTLTQLSSVGEVEMAKLRERRHGRPVTRLEIWKNVGRYLLRHSLYHRLYSLGLLRY